MKGVNTHCYLPIIELYVVILIFYSLKFGLIIPLPSRQQNRPHAPPHPHPPHIPHSHHPRRQTCLPRRTNYNHVSTRNIIPTRPHNRFKLINHHRLCNSIHSQRNQATNRPQTKPTYHTYFLYISTPVHKTNHPVLRSHQPQHLNNFPAVLHH